MNRERTQYGRLPARGVYYGVAGAGLLFCAASLWTGSELQDSATKRFVAAPHTAAAVIVREERIKNERHIAMVEADLFEALLPAANKAPGFARPDDAPADGDELPPAAHTANSLPALAEFAAYDEIVAERHALVKNARAFLQARSQTPRPQARWRSHRGDGPTGSPFRALVHRCSAVGAGGGKLHDFDPGGGASDYHSIRLPDRRPRIQAYMGTQPADGTVSAVVRLHFFAFRNGYHGRPEIAFTNQCNPPIARLRRLFASRRTSSRQPHADPFLRFSPHTTRIFALAHLFGDPS